MKKRNIRKTAAALTALALIASYIEKVQEVGAAVTFNDFSVMTPVVLVGLFVGACLPFVFAALTMQSVGRAAQRAACGPVHRGGGPPSVQGDRWPDGRQSRCRLRPLR